MSQRKPDQESKLITLISKETRLKGKLKTSDDVRIDGHFIGDIEVTGKLVTGPESYIKGTVSAIDIVLGGELKGNAKGVWSITLQPTASVKGDLSTEELTIEQGAFFDGKSNMTQKGKGVIAPEETLHLQEA